MSLISTLYSTVGFVIIAGYMPQIFRLVRTTTNCMDISIPAWAIWNYTSVISLLYGIFEMHDPKFIFVCATNVLCINAVIFITLYKRYKYAKRALDKKRTL